MGFVPSAADDFPGRPPGLIDYRLARQAVLQGYRAGELTSTDVCDAHPELRRAAAMCSEAGNEDCPICGECELRLVRYVFGPRLPCHGRCITSSAELARIAGRRGEFTCYVVEVCPGCGWNHLQQAYVLSDSQS